MIVGLSFHHFGEDKELLVDAAVAEVVVAEEAVEAVVAVVQDQPPTRTGSRDRRNEIFSRTTEGKNKTKSVYRNGHM